MQKFLISIHVIFIALFSLAIIELAAEMSDDWLGINQVSILLVLMMLVASVGAVWVCFKGYKWSQAYAWSVLGIDFVLLFLPALMFVGFDLVGLV